MTKNRMSMSFRVHQNWILYCPERRCNEKITEGYFHLTDIKTKKIVQSWSRIEVKHVPYDQKKFKNMINQKISPKSFERIDEILSKTEWIWWIKDRRINYLWTFHWFSNIQSICRNMDELSSLKKDCSSTFDILKFFTFNYLIESSFLFDPLLKSHWFDLTFVVQIILTLRIVLRVTWWTESHDSFSLFLHVTMHVWRLWNDVMDGNVLEQ